MSQMTLIRHENLLSLIFLFETLTQLNKFGPRQVIRPKYVGQSRYAGQNSCPKFTELWWLTESWASRYFQIYFHNAQKNKKKICFHNMWFDGCRERCVKTERVETQKKCKYYLLSHKLKFEFHQFLQFKIHFSKGLIKSQNMNEEVFFFPQEKETMPTKNALLYNLLRWQQWAAKSRMRIK